MIGLIKNKYKVMPLRRSYISSWICIQRSLWSWGNWKVVRQSDTFLCSLILMNNKLPYLIFRILAWMQFSFRFLSRKLWYSISCYFRLPVPNSLKPIIVVREIFHKQSLHRDCLPHPRRSSKIESIRIYSLSDIL